MFPPWPCHPDLWLKFLPTPLRRPQPVVAHLRPAGSTSSGEARQTGEMRFVYWAGEASFSSVRSLFRVAGFQEGCVMACGTRKGDGGGHRPPRVDGC